MLTFPEIIAQVAQLPVPAPAHRQEARWRHRAQIYCAVLAVGINLPKLTAFTGLSREDLEPILDSLHNNDLLRTGALHENYVKQFLRAGDAIVDQIVGHRSALPMAATAEAVPTITTHRPRRNGKETKTALIQRLILQQSGPFDLAAIRAPYCAATAAEHKAATAAVMYVLSQLLKANRLHIVSERSKYKGGALYEVVKRVAI